MKRPWYLRTWFAVPVLTCAPIALGSIVRVIIGEDSPLPFYVSVGGWIGLGWLLCSMWNSYAARHGHRSDL